MCQTQRGSREPLRFSDQRTVATVEGGRNENCEELDDKKKRAQCGSLPFQERTDVLYFISLNVSSTKEDFESARIFRRRFALQPVADSL